MTLEQESQLAYQESIHESNQARAQSTQESIDAGYASRVTAASEAANAGN